MDEYVEGGQFREASKTERPLSEGLSQVRSILGERASALIPQDKPVVEVVREDYNNSSVGEGNAVDGKIFKVRFADGSETYVLTHRTIFDYRRGEVNPFAAMNYSLAMLGGADFRRWATFTYEWDGQNTITATDPAGRRQEITGKWGVPDAMLPTLKAGLQSNEGAAKIGEQRFVGNPPPPGV